MYWTTSFPCTPDATARAAAAQEISLVAFTGPIRS